MFKTISGQNIRSFSSFNLSLSPTVNLFCGLNGAGKTSLLEALYLLAVGKSFRASRLIELISHTADHGVVSGGLQDTTGNEVRVGVEQHRGGRRLLKVAGKVVQSNAELAKILPVQVLNQHSFSLLEGGPSLRREFVDWGVFHVEQSFHAIWRQYSRALQQRNLALKNRTGHVGAWNEQLAAQGELLEAARKRYLGLLEIAFTKVLPVLCEQMPISLNYEPGWQPGMPLLTALQQAEGVDIRRGYTTVGPHRAELGVLVDNHLAKEVLSRGQIKRVVTALHLARGALLQRHLGCYGVYLLDDLSAELDDLGVHKVVKYLEEWGGQVIMTAIDPRITTLFSKTVRAQVFHVEHGQVVSEQAFHVEQAECPLAL